MTDKYYILDENGHPVPESDLLKWSAWLGGGDDKRRVALNMIPGTWRNPDGIRVSTVFLGLDHNFIGDGPPILWETMIFGGRRDGYQRRYSSLYAAIEGHKEALRLAKGRWWNAW